MKNFQTKTIYSRLAALSLAASAVFVLAGCPPTHEDFLPNGAWLVQQNNVTIGSEYGTTRSNVANTITFAQLGTPTPSAQTVTMTYNQTTQVLAVSSTTSAVTLNSDHYGSVRVLSGSATALTPGCEMRSSLNFEIGFNHAGDTADIGVITRIEFRTIPAMVNPCAAYMAATKAYFESMSAFPASPVQSRLTQWTINGGLDISQLQALSAMTARINASANRLAPAAASELTAQTAEEFVLDIAQASELSQALTNEWVALTQILVDAGYLN